MADSGPTRTQAALHLDHIAEQAGLGIMSSAGVLGLLLDRQGVSYAQLLVLESGDVVRLYERHMAPAIDRLEITIKENDL